MTTTSSQPGMGQSFLWSAVRNWGTRLGSVAVFLVLARILDREQLGLFSATLAIMAIADLFAENGLGDAVVQASELNDRILSAAMILNLGLACLLAAALVAGSTAAETYFSAPGLSSILSVTVLALLFNGASYVPQSLFRRRFEYKWLAVRALIATAVSGAIGIALAVLGWGAWSMVAQAILFALINCGVVWLRPPFNPLVRPSFSQARRLIAFGGSILFGRVLYYLSTRAIELVILYRFGAIRLSLYIIGSRIYFVCTQLLTAVLVDVAFSSFSRLGSDRTELQKTFYSTLRLATAVTVPVFLGLSVIAPELAVIAFDDKGPDAAPYLTYVALFGSLQVSYFFFGSALSALGRPNASNIILILQCCLSAAILLPPWPIGPVATVSLNSAALVIVTPIYLVMCVRIGHFSLGRILAAVWPPYLAGGVMYAGVYGARILIEPFVGGVFLRGSALAAIGAGIFAALLALLSPDTVRSLLSFARKRQQRSRPAATD